MTPIDAPKLSEIAVIRNQRNSVLNGEGPFRARGTGWSKNGIKFGGW